MEIASSSIPRATRLIVQPIFAWCIQSRRGEVMRLLAFPRGFYKLLKKLSLNLS